MFDKILGQLTGNSMVTGIAEKLGIDPEQAAQAVAALGQSHGEDGDTIELAAEKTGIDAGVLNQIRDAVGGEGSLGNLTSMLDKDGDGNPINDIAGMAKGLFGRS